MTNVYQASQLLFCLHITLKMPLNKAIENGVQVKLFKIFVHTYRSQAFMPQAKTYQVFLMVNCFIVFIHDMKLKSVL